jgi:hypothetical protein
MRSFRYRDDEPTLGSIVTGITVGALAGFAVGVVVAQKVGGISGLAARLRSRLRDLERGDEDAIGADEYDELDEGDLEDEETALEERVLEAFRNDPVLSERAVDIGAIGDGIIELSGWVDTADESEHATTIARGTPGVVTVVNRIVVGEDEESETDGDQDGPADESDPIPGGRWDGQRVGTGRRRQGTSGELDRHADPKPDLEARWLDEQHALEAAAGETEGVAERRKTGKKSARGGRADGSPIAPTGVPKADHVTDPESATDAGPEPRAD